MAQLFYLEYEDGTWYISDYRLADTIIGSGPEECMSALIAEIGENVILADMESADAARMMGLW